MAPDWEEVPGRNGRVSDDGGLQSYGDVTEGCKTNNFHKLFLAGRSRIGLASEVRFKFSTFTQERIFCYVETRQPTASTISTRRS